MTKYPIKTYVCSDGKSYNEREDAVIHEAFLGPKFESKRIGNFVTVSDPGNLKSCKKCVFYTVGTNVCGGFSEDCCFEEHIWKYEPKKKKRRRKEEEKKKKIERWMIVNEWGDFYYLRNGEDFFTSDKDRAYIYNTHMVGRQVIALIKKGNKVKAIPKNGK